MGVFGVVESPENDAARIAGVRQRLGGQKCSQPVAERPPLLVGGLVGFRGRHLAAGHHVFDALQELGMLAERGGVVGEREVHFPLGRVS